MSFKRKIQYQFRHFMQAIFSLSLPYWLVSKTTRVILVAVVVFGGLGHIIQTTSTSSSGYRISELETEIIVLEDEISRIQIDIANDSSLTTIEQRLKELDLVEVKKISYYEEEKQIVAKR